MNKDQMFCRNCGSMIGRTDNFCYKCGVSQRDVVDNNESKKSSPKVSEVLSAIINKPNLVPKESQKVGVTLSEGIRLPRKEREAMSFGILLQLIWFIVLILIQTDAIYLSKSLYTILLLWTILIRIIAVRWVRGIARRIKRNITNWSLFAFLAPTVALIIIGNLSYNKRTIHKFKTDTIT